MFKYFKPKKICLRQVRVSSASSPRESGFTLVEMLVAIAVFMSVMTVAVTALLTIINANRETQAIKTTTDDVTFAIENISKDMRIGGGYQCIVDVDSDSKDGPFPPESKNCSAGSNEVKYIANDGITTVIYKFFPKTGELLRTTTGFNSSQGEIVTVPEDLISTDSDVHISSMRFYVIGSDCENGGGSCSAKTQPSVIITISGVISSKGTASINFDLQTTISQSSRNG